jgi:uncharacterized protein DUF998
LSAIGAPTRPMWVPLGLAYNLLLLAFGVGVWKSAGPKRTLRVVGALLVAYAVFGFGWPPMHQREVMAAGGGTLTDTLHIVWSVVTVFFMFLFISFGASAFGSGFRLYSIATILVLLAFGALTGMSGPRIAENLPTPWIGVWERISIFAEMLWIAVLAISLLQTQTAGIERRRRRAIEMRQELQGAATRETASTGNAAANPLGGKG